jgi:transmembrane sensor
LIVVENSSPYAVCPDERTMSFFSQLLGGPAGSLIDRQAGAWLARRDRGLTAREQDDYLQWLRADDRHAAAVSRAEATLRRLVKLGAWRSELSAEPNPDLFARSTRRAWPRLAVAAAAVFAAGLGWWALVPKPAGPATVAGKTYLRVNERRLLPDGSQVELKDGSGIEVRYTAGERRVQLMGGEAQFSVMKDKARPFVVEAGGVAVRAVGTVFVVRLGSDDVDVLVTEGKVRVGAAAQEPGKIFQAHAPENEPPTIAAGQRVVMARGATAVPVIADVSTEEIGRALAWQAPRLRFDETPLTEAVAEFNRHNRRQLVLGDPALGVLPVGGTFRADNVDGFVNLLSITLGVRSEPRGPDETVLWRGK